MMSYEELYKAIRGTDKELKKQASEELTSMSDQDWSDYIEYRDAMDKRHVGN